MDGSLLLAFFLEVRKIVCSYYNVSLIVYNATGHSCIASISCVASYRAAMSLSA